VAFWMNWGGGDAQMPFGWNTNYDLFFYNGYFGINTGNADVLGISSAGLINQWVHVAVVFPNGVPSASNSKIYINGNLVSLTQGKGTPLSRTATPGVFLSGWGFDSNYKFGGSLDDVRIYSRELAAAEVAALVGAAPNGLVGCWKLHDGSGTIAADSSGFGHNGALTNGPQWKEDTFGWDVQFNGGIQTITAGGVGVNSAAGVSNTVAFWMNWSGGDVQMPFGWSTNYDLFLYNGYFGINTGNADVLGISSAGLANHWVHVAAVFPNGVPSTANSKIYINGNLQTIAQLKGTPLSRAATPGVFMSGWGFDSNYKLGGNLDEVRIYNRELTAAEVAALAGGSTSGSLVGYWKLDDGSGAVAVDASGFRPQCSSGQRPAVGGGEVRWGCSV